MKIFIGSDHNGYTLKNYLVNELKRHGYEVEDEGDHELDPNDDFPIFATKVVHQMNQHQDSRGILLCGSGQGMAIMANRFKGIRAAVVWNKEQARLARNDDDSNVIAVPGEVLKDSPEKTLDIVLEWLKTPFEKIERRVRRIKQMDEL